MTTETNMTEREEIEMLLPWYATGKLTRADHQRVEAFLASHPEMARQMELIADERHSSLDLNEAIAPPRGQALEKLMAAAAASPPRGAARASLIAKIKAFFEVPTSGPVRWAAAAAAAIILVQAVTLGALLVNREATYQTASGEPSAGSDGTFALVRFSDTASVKAVGDLLTELNVVIIDGPKPGGLYRVRLGPKDLPAAERDRKLAELRSRPGVIVLVMPST